MHADPTGNSQDRICIRPYTAFGGESNEHGDVALSSIDWNSVVKEEAVRVVDWLLYLPSEDPAAVRELLHALSVFLREKDESCPQWKAYTGAGLHVVLVDMFIDIGVLNDVEPLASNVRAYLLFLDA